MYQKNTKLIRSLALALPLGLASASPALLAQEADTGGQSRKVYEQPLVSETIPTSAARHAQQLNAQLGTPFIGEDAKGPAVLRAQVLLDRHWFSPGQIDGYYGRNTRHAILAFQRARGLEPTGTVDQQTWQALLQQPIGPAFATYQLTQEDVDGPFKKIPDDPRQMADMERLYYETLQEMLGEKFHVKPDLLVALNKNRPLRAGQTIVVPNVGKNVPLPDGDKKIRISKSEEMLYLLDQNDRLVGAFPISIGGRGDEIPVGRKLEINSDVKNPDFEYDASLLDEYDGPDVVVPPGPNSPVGLVWMGLTKPHWGIHGTSAPSEMARVETNGCIRMTNWDVLRLTEHVGIGTEVMLVS